MKIVNLVWNTMVEGKERRKQESDQVKYTSNEGLVFIVECPQNALFECVSRSGREIVQT